MLSPFFSFLTSLHMLVHSLPKAKHDEENANFQKPIRIEENAIHCRSRCNYANMLGNSQSNFHVKKYVKRAVLQDTSFMKGYRS